MKKLIVAKSAGFCFGVARAVKMAQKALEASVCYSLGQIIHNDDLVALLEQNGLNTVESIEELPPRSRVVVRSHGIGRGDYEQLSVRGAEIIDATCPKVTKIHKIAEDASKSGKQVFIIGAQEHPEVKAISAWCNNALVFRSAQELEKFLADNSEMCKNPSALVFQTTQTQKNLTDSKKIIKKLCTNCEIFDTICDATSLRQKEACEIATQCDSVVVIGGRHSANSAHLAEICREHCDCVLFIENASELDLSTLDGADTIGVTAGASTPAWIIKEVVQKMSDEIKVEEIDETMAEETTEPEVSSTEAIEEFIAEEPVEAAVEAVAEEPVEAAVEAAVEEPVETAVEAAVEEPVEAVVEEPAEEPVEEPAEAPKSDEEKSFDELLEDSIKTIYNGETVTGIIAAITPTEVSVDLGTKHSGYIPLSEFTDDPSIKLDEVLSIGDKIDACVVRVDDVEGTVKLSKKRLDAVKSWSEVEAAREDGTTVEGTVTEENKGGVVVSVNGLRVFVPASQTGIPKDEPMTSLLKTKVRLKITEVNRSRRRIVGSIRAVASRERRELADKIWAEIEVGARYAGVVKSLTSYGAFVDIGGIDGMVHVSELSWGRVKQPSEIINVGDEVNVYVINFDKDARKISLGYKNPDENPWSKFAATCAVDDIVKVTIVKLMPFGAFAEVMSGVDGLIHISQIADRRIGKPDEVLSVGDVVEVKITNIDFEKQKISLSIRALLEPAFVPAEEEGEVKEVSENDALVYEVSETGEASGNKPEEERGEE